jgi:hypothetical protein
MWSAVPAMMLVIILLLSSSSSQDTINRSVGDHNGYELKVGHLLGSMTWEGTESFVFGHRLAKNPYFADFRKTPAIPE